MQKEFEHEELRLTMSGKRKNALDKGARMRSDEDSLGSYTGVTVGNEYEAPTQDADDL